MPGLRTTLACLFSFLMPLLAQTGAGRIQGTVKDASGAVIPNARVRAEDIATGNSFNTESNRDGFFIFPSAQPGTYRVTAESPGLEKWQGDLQLLTGGRQPHPAESPAQSAQPSHQPIWPTPANPSPSDPNFALYGTNLVVVPLKNGTQQRIAYDNGLNPLRNQFIPGPWAWTVNSSLFKIVPVTERVKLRLNMDAFNVFNMPGNQLPDANTGILSLRNSNNAPRQLPWTLRLSW